MAGIAKLMKRLGYVKLGDYGLLVTPDDRIVATRPAVLDDGFGARVVGWRGDDLAAAELQPFGQKPARATVARPTPPPIPVAAKPAPVAPAALVAMKRPLPGVAPYVPPIVPAPVIPAVAATPIKAAPIEPEEMGEDEWEWEIVMARARAAAEEVELAARVIPIAQGRRLPLPAERAPSAAPVRQVVQTPVIPLVARKPASPPTLETPTRPGVAPFPASAEVGDDTQVTLTAAMKKQSSMPRASSPKTIIPVPKLPSNESVARARFPKGTTEATDITRTDVQVKSAPTSATMRSDSRGTLPSIKHRRQAT